MIRLAIIGATISAAVTGADIGTGRHPPPDGPWRWRQAEMWGR